MWQDLRYALRTLRQKPGFAAVTLSTLALGIGATTVMFTVINGVLLKPLPYADPDRLVAIHGQSVSWNASAFGDQNVRLPRLSRLRSETADRSIWRDCVFNGGTLSEPGEAEYIVQYGATANAFSVLGVPLFRGRPFLPEEDKPGGTPVAILGYSLWQRHFGGDPAAIGTSLVFDTKRYTVVGITAPGFQFNERGGFVYAGGARIPPLICSMRRAHPVTVVARLRPGATLTQAQTELDLFGRHLAEQYPATNGGRSFNVEAAASRCRRCAVHAVAAAGRGDAWCC